MKSVKCVDLNSDIGESESVEGMKRDECLIKNISSANIACGFHAGSPELMMRTAKICLNEGVGIGAHPSFLDRENFGRRRIEIDKDKLTSQIIYQVGALDGICKSLGTKVFHIKPHGALYNVSAKEEKYAEAVVISAKHLSKTLLTLPNSLVQKIAEDEGVRVFIEGFADRGYMRNGSLAPREREDALFTDPDTAAERALALVDGEKIRTVDGSYIELKVQSICIHSDTPNSCEMARKVRERLIQAGIEIKSLAEVYGY